MKPLKSFIDQKMQAKIDRSTRNDVSPVNWRRSEGVEVREVGVQELVEAM